jgi:glycerophosphoryl diester phosphodiesterase
VPIGFAHRGARLEEAENTLPAFRRALEAGATGLETDAWLSADGEVVLVHDATVGRGLRRQRVDALRADELAARDVPRLADLYRELGTAFELSVDAKTPAVAEPLVAVADAHGAAERLWVCSPDVAVLLPLRGRGARLVHSPPFKRSVVDPLERHAANLAAAGIDAINLHHTDWSAGLVSLFHRFDRRAFAWDAQEVRHLRAVLRMGVDAVYCDRPDRMVATIGEWRAEGSGA